MCMFCLKNRGRRALTDPLTDAAGFASGEIVPPDFLTIRSGSLLRNSGSDQRPRFTCWPLLTKHAVPLSCSRNLRIPSRLACRDRLDRGAFAPAEIHRRAIGPAAPGAVHIPLANCVQSVANSCFRFRTNRRAAAECYPRVFCSYPDSTGVPSGAVNRNTPALASREILGAIQGS